MSLPITHDRGTALVSPGKPGAIWACAIVIGVMLAATLLGWAIDSRQFAFSYLIAWVFAVSLAAGALFWVMLHHLTNATWSVVVRRTAEHFAFAMLPLAVLGIPALLNLAQTHGWVAHHDHVWEKKAAYLNRPFFLIRTVVFLAAWSWMAWRMRFWSLKHDETGDAGLIRRMRWHCPTGLLMLGVTTTFFAFDWLMSLEWHWTSTMFGVTFWAGAIVGSLAAIILALLALRGAGVTAITEEHLHDLGKLLFGFTIFWAYVSFSQYFLIWYANLSEETPWYLHRLTGTWRGVSIGLLVGHFVLPFAWLLPRDAKRTPWRIGIAAGWLLAFHYLDIHWQAMPVLHEEGFAPSWLDATAIAAMLGVVALVVWHGLRTHAPIPVGDPKLPASLAHHNE